MRRAAEAPVVIVALAALYAVVLLLNSTTVGILGDAVETVPIPTTLLVPSTLTKLEPAADNVIKSVVNDSLVSVSPE